MNHNNGYVMKGESAHIKDVMRKIDLVARYDTPVLVYGETGTGKEIVATQIHTKSKRNSKPFIPINCGAIPRELVETELFGYETGAFTGASRDYPGAFLLANEGTLFLDEVGAMPLDAQPKLLRVLENGNFRQIGGRKEQCVDVRIVSATNDPGIYDSKRFREDLYYRLGVYRIDLKPLRERQEDIGPIASHFIEMWEKRNSSERALQPETLSLLMSYNWPGNVRELRTVLERACIEADGGVLSPALIREKIEQSETRRHKTIYDDFKTNVYPDGFTTNIKFTWDTGRVKHMLMREQIKAALTATNGNSTEAAVKLGITRGNLYSRAKRYGLNIESYRREVIGLYRSKQPDK